MTAAAQREALKLVESLGLEVIDQEIARGHLKVKLHCPPDGRPFWFNFSLASGRDTIDKGVRADLTRRAREHPASTQSLITTQNTALGLALEKASRQVKLAARPAPAPSAAPVQQKAPPMTTDLDGHKVTNKRNSLNISQQFKIITWMKENPRAWETWREAAEVISKALGITLTPGNMPPLFDAAEVPRPKATTARAMGPVALEKRIARIEAFCASLAAELKINLPDDWGK